MDALGLYGLKGMGSYDPVSGNFAYRVGNMGRVIPYWKYLDPVDKERELYNLQALDARVEAESQARIESLVKITPYKVNDYRDSEHVRAIREIERKEVLLAEQRVRTEEVGTLMGRFTGYSPPLKTDFELWKEARDCYAKGTMTLDQVLRHVNLLDADLYDKVVEEELYGAHKHWFSWRRWSVWRRLVRWYHRRNLGRHWDG